MQKLFLTADFGGTTIKVGLVADGRVAAQEAIPAEARSALGERLGAIAQSWRRLAEQARLDPEAAQAAGIGLPCLVDPRAARVLSGIDKYPDAASFDIPAWFREHLGVPVAVENDAKAALLGEWQFGAGRGARDVVLMGLGTGIGTAAVVGGVLLEGATGAAGNLGGHLLVPGEAGRCACGTLGCAEAAASGWALPAAARADLAFATSRLAARPEVTVETIFREADEGDALAQRLVERAATAWKAAALNLTRAYDPSVLVLTGGILRARRDLVGEIQAHLDSQVWAGLAAPRVVRGLLGGDGALLGLAWAASAKAER